MPQLRQFYRRYQFLALQQQQLDNDRECLIPSKTVRVYLSINTSLVARDLLNAKIIG
tara:strand:+ start:267 stop:437 length:171 start_codon:yes stop_codon:yes gene_type:complete